MPHVEGYTLSPKQAAALLGMDPDTIRRWADNGTLKCWKTPSGWRRFRESDVLALLPNGHKA